MTLVSDVQMLRRRVEDVEKKVTDDSSITQRHEEQINGERGLSAELKDIRTELHGLKRTIWTVGTLIFLAMASFSISVLVVFGQ